jgi:hypothetical protein
MREVTGQLRSEGPSFVGHAQKLRPQAVVLTIVT